MWYTHHPDGQRKSKLRLPSSTPAATVWNWNTVQELVVLADGL